jgi:protein-tyrosine phosphatase
MNNDTNNPVLQPEIDLHCHVLPSWDDGPRAFEQTVELLAAASAKGIRQVAVTPHVGRPLPKVQERPANEIPAAVAALEQQVREQGVDIHLIPGAELTFGESELPKRIGDEPWLTLGGQGRYLLIESTFGQWPLFANQFLYQLSLAGVTAIIAHPERLPDVQNNIHILDDVVRMGAVLQLTAGSIVGNEERRTRNCSRQLLEAGMVGVIASDAHSARAVWPGDVADEVQAIVGESLARQILIDNPRAIVEGQPVVLSQTPQPPAKTNFLSKALAFLQRR